MSHGRMFEYTPVDIEKRLENLRSDALQFIDRLPTFVCSEISSSKRISMIVRFGTIGGTSVSHKEVTTIFTPIVEFGEVIFEDVEAARRLFGADGFQLYRTHRAVREGDVTHILNALAALKRSGRSLASHSTGASRLRPSSMTGMPRRISAIDTTLMNERSSSSLSSH